MRLFGLATVAAALTVSATPALAADPLVLTNASPAGRVAIAPMSDVTFSAALAGPVEDPQIRISDRSPLASGLLIPTAGGGAMASSPLSGRYTFHLEALSPLRADPGTYWWQVTGLRRNAAGVLEIAASAPQRVETYFPSAWTKRGPIDRRFGRHGHARFLLSSRNIPSGVDPARLKKIVAVSARRWGLLLTGWTNRVAGARDHANVAGFGGVPVSGALAVQADLYAKRYRVFQHCTEQRLNGVVVNRTCGPVQRKYLGRVRTDQDLIIRTDVPWGMGPSHPAQNEYDLESVVLHELGHMAGNKKHSPRCMNSPMGPTLGMGEWWRTPHDWFRRGCPLSAPRDVL
jgi:hypothetical protein